MVRALHIEPSISHGCFDHAARLEFSVANFGAILTFNCAVAILLVFAFIAMFECARVLVSLEVLGKGYHTKQKRTVCFIQ